MRASSAPSASMPSMLVAALTALAVVAQAEGDTAYTIGRFFGYALVIALVFFGVRWLLRRGTDDGSGAPPVTPAGWYPNPDGTGERWFDGERWHDRYRSGPGDPSDPGPPPPPAPPGGR